MNFSFMCGFFKTLSLRVYGPTKMDVLCALEINSPKTPKQILFSVADRFKLKSESIRKGGIENRLESLENEKLASRKPDGSGFIVTDIGVSRRYDSLYPAKWKDGKHYLPDKT